MCKNRKTARTLLGLMSSVLIASCASHTHEIEAAYISPQEYQNFSCADLRAEVGRLSRRAQEVAMKVNDNAEDDTAAMAAGLIVFWPALFFIDGDEPEAMEYAQLKGRYNVIESMAATKKCDLRIEKNPFAEIEAAQKTQAEVERSDPNE